MTIKQQIKLSHKYKLPMYSQLYRDLVKHDNLMVVHNVLIPYPIPSKVMQVSIMVAPDGIVFSAE